MYNETGLIVAMVMVMVFVIGTVVCSVKKIDVNSEIEIFMMSVLWKLSRRTKKAIGVLLTVCMAFLACFMVNAAFRSLSGVTMSVYVSTTGPYVFMAMVATQVIDRLLGAQKKSLDVRTELV